MDIHIAKEFQNACNAAFGFLVTDHGFQPSTLKINPRIHFATVTFLGRHVAVECIFDQNESWVEVKIAKVVNGATTGEYSTDSTGHRVREGLYPLLIRRGLDTDQPTDWRGGSERRGTTPHQFAAPDLCRKPTL